MGESPSPGSPPKQEDGELSNDGDLSHLFVVDNAPAEPSDQRIDVPVYDKKFREVLDVKKDDEPPKPKRPQPQQNSCWNCGGDHSLRDCTEPRNHDAINRNRIQFRNKQASRTGKSNNRYHLDDEQKFAHLRPGKISRQLQRALGLEPNQLPRHVYRMRVLGYPPGWVEEARVSHSGLSLFNSDGKEVADPEDEDGEIIVEGGRDKYDFKKIIEFPGFNCPTAPDIIDESDRLNCRPMAEKDSIKFMKKMWGNKAVKAYKRRKMNSSGTPSSEKKRSQLDDSELDLEDAALCNEDKEISEVNEENLKEETQMQTPTQGVKRGGSPTPCPEDSKRQKVEDGESEIGEGTSKQLSESEGTDSPSVQRTPVGKITSVSLGTPVIVTSKFTCLPSADKFSKDICDVINFENLPDSTGKYEKMSGLLQKVRSFRSRLESQSDDDEEEDNDGDDN